MSKTTRMPGSPGMRKRPRRQHDQTPEYALTAPPYVQLCGTSSDTLGLLIGLVVHGANIQDRDGAPQVLKSIRHSFPWLRHVFADGGYAGPKLHSALNKIGDWRLQIVKRSDTAKGFEVLPRRNALSEPRLYAYPLWL